MCVVRPDVFIIPTRHAGMEIIMVNINATTTNKAAYPDTILSMADTAPDALVLNGDIVTRGPVINGDAPSARLAFISEDPSANVVKEGQLIGEGDPVLDELVVRTSKVAILSNMSNESYASATAGNLVATSARRAVTKKLDSILLANAVTEGQPTGLLNIAGINTIEGGKYSDLNPILKAIGTCAANNANPTAIVLNYATWVNLLTLTAKDGRPLVSPDVANAAQPILFGLPVVLSSAMPADTALVVDSSEIIASYSDVTTSVSADALFAYDSVQLRLTARLGFGIIRPNRLAKVTFTPNA